MVPAVETIEVEIVEEVNKRPGKWGGLKKVKYMVSCPMFGEMIHDRNCATCQHCRIAKADKVRCGYKRDRYMKRATIATEMHYIDGPRTSE